MNANTTILRSRSARVALYLTFATMGATAATVPATIPVVSGLGSGELDAYLRAVPALFFGLLIGVLVSSAAGGWLAPRTFLLAGSTLQLLGFAALTMTVDPWPFSALALVIGIGFGLVEAGGSIIARAVAGGGTARLLSSLTGTVAVVAAGVPLLLALTPLGASPAAAYTLVAAVHLAAFVTTALATHRTALSGTSELVTSTAQAPSIVVSSDVAEGNAAHETQVSERRPVLGNGIALTLVPISISLALYVGVETVYAGWSATIPLRVLGVEAQHAAIGTATFWILLAGGRYFASFVLGRGVVATRYLLITTTVAALALGVTALTVTGQPIVAAAALCVAVVGLGPCYSLILGVGLARVPVESARRATGLLVACGAAGGSFIPAILLAVSRDPTGPVTFAATAILTAGFGVFVVLRVRSVVSIATEPVGF